MLGGYILNLVRAARAEGTPTKIVFAVVSHKISTPVVSPRLVHSWDLKRIYSYSRVFPIGGELGAYSPGVFGRFGRFRYSAVSGFRAFLGGI